MLRWAPLLAFVLAAGLPGRAQTLFTYDFSTVTTTSGRSFAGGTASNLTFSSFTASTSLGSNSNAGGVFAFSGWPTGATNGSNTFTGSVDTSAYFQFSVTPASGYQFTLSSLTFDAGRTAAGPRQFEIRSSVDNYTANLPATAATPVTVTGSNIFQFTDNSTTNLIPAQSVTLTSADFANQTSTVTFRIYGFNQEGGGFLRIDNFAVNGTVSAVPEPSAYAALMGAAALVGTMLHRRRQRRLVG